MLVGEIIFAYFAMGERRLCGGILDRVYNGRHEGRARFRGGRLVREEFTALFRRRFGAAAAVVVRFVVENNVLKK